MPIFDTRLSSAEAAAELAKASATSPAGAIGFWKIVFAVMFGNLMAGFVAAIVYAISQVK